MEDRIEVTFTEQKLKPGVCFPMGKERIWWRILEIDEEKQTALVIADRPVCDRRYHEKWENVTWEKCDLRTWLNGEYLNDTFSVEERDAIMESDIGTPDNPRYHTKGGEPTRDRIFLLSIDEAERYFKDDTDRACGGLWWLRSPGYNLYNAAYVRSGGSIYIYGGGVDFSGGVSPAFWINLDSRFFQSVIRTVPEKGAVIRTPDLHMHGRTAVSVRPNLRLQSVVVPDGTEEIGERCFARMGIKSVTLPSTLKKIGKEAFSGCNGLQTILCASDSVSWGKDALSECGKFCYTPELYRTKGKLCDSFAEHLKDPGTDILVWVHLYQKGKVWDEILPKKVSKKNASEILNGMTERISDLSGSVKKEAKAGCDYALKHASLLDRESVSEFLEMLRTKKCADLADELIKDPAVGLLAGSNEPSEENEEQVVLPDGTVLIGSLEAEFTEGSMIRMGKDPYSVWRVLKIDEEKRQALMIAIQPVCDRPYHKKFEDITWEKCDLRTWLNGEYLNDTFSEEERDAILESDIETPDNPQYHTRGGAPTRDRVFLLSIDEAERYFKEDTERVCGSWWWLRSPGYHQYLAANVDFAGGIDVGGRIVLDCIGVRPAFWINLNSQFSQSLIRTDADGKRIVRLPLFSVKSGVLTKVYPWAENIFLPEYVKEIAPGAAQYCNSLRAMEWKAELIKIAKGAIQNCPKLRFPARLYQTEKKLNAELAPFIPDDAKAIAAVLKYQPDQLKWANDIIRNVGEDRVCDLLDEMRRENPANADLEWILAAAPYAGSYRRVYVDSSEYKRGASGYLKHPTAEKVADRIGHRKLIEKLENEKLTGAHDHWYAPYAVYAEEDQLRELIRTMKTWEKEGKAGKERIIRVRGAILLNDTKEAMRYADSLGLLDRYAKLRGMDEDEIRDRILSDFGLGADGKRSWVLAGKTYTATLNNDLSVTLSDEEGKELRSLPKRGADPEAYETANKEFTSLKKEIKSTAKIRNDKIFADFLSGRKRPGKDWKDSYMQNPLLKILARLIVWEQEKQTFILKEDGKAYDVNGDPYTVTDKPVRIAHPMDMGKEDMEAWQLYFNRSRLKQPFEQVWEPVVDASTVKAGRYDGCTIELYRLMNKEKHGIVMKGQSELELAGCSADLNLVEGTSDWVHNKFEIRNFRYKTYNRQVNHIVVHFDKGTVEGRILKDDVSVRMWLDNFTAAQISEFAGLAAKNGCTNVTAMLLEYQNEHFTAFDPMEEFTLDLL